MRQALLLAAISFSFATPVRAGQAGVTPVRVGGSIMPPLKIKDVRPESPAEWQRQGGGMEGVVTIDVTLNL